MAQVLNRLKPKKTREQRRASNATRTTGSQIDPIYNNFLRTANGRIGYTLADVDIVNMFVKLKKYAPIIKNTTKWTEINLDLDELRTMLLNTDECQQPPVPAAPPAGQTNPEPDGNNCRIPNIDIPQLQGGTNPRAYSSPLHTQAHNITFTERFCEIIADLWVMITAGLQGRKYDTIKYSAGTKRIINALRNYLQILLNPGTNSHSPDRKKFDSRYHDAIKKLTDLTTKMHGKHKKRTVREGIGEISSLSKNKASKVDTYSRLNYLTQLTEYIINVGQSTELASRTFLNSVVNGNDPIILTVLVNLFNTYLLIYLVANILNVHSRHNPAAVALVGAAIPGGTSQQLREQVRRIVYANNLEIMAINKLMEISMMGHTNVANDINICYPIINNIARTHLNIPQANVPTVIWNTPGNPAVPTIMNTGSTGLGQRITENLYVIIRDGIVNIFNGTNETVTAGLNNLYGTQAPNPGGNYATHSYDLEVDIDESINYGAICLLSNAIVMNLFSAEIGRTIGVTQPQARGFKKAIIDFVNNQDFTTFDRDYTDHARVIIPGGDTVGPDDAQNMTQLGNFDDAALRQQITEIRDQIIDGINNNNAEDTKSRQIRMQNLIKKTGSLVEHFNILKYYVNRMSLVNGSNLINEYDKPFIHDNAGNGNDIWGWNNIDDRGINVLYSEIVQMNYDNTMYVHNPQPLPAANPDIAGNNQFKLASLIRKILEIYKRYGIIVFNLFGHSEQVPDVVRGLGGNPTNNQKANSVLPKSITEMLKAQIDIYSAGNTSLIMSYNLSAIWKLRTSSQQDSQTVQNLIANNNIIAYNNAQNDITQLKTDHKTYLHTAWEDGLGLNQADADRLVDNMIPL